MEVTPFSNQTQVNFFIYQYFEFEFHFDIFKN